MSSLLCCFNFKKKKKPAAASSNLATGSPPVAVDQHQLIKDAFLQLEIDPENAEQQKKFEDAFDQHPNTVYDILKEEAAKSTEPPPAPTAVSLAGPNLPALTDDDTDWANCIGEQRCTPLKKVRPETLQDLVDIVSSARALNQRVRAIGSGHAFSDVARTDGAVLINPVLLNNVTVVNKTLLKAGALEGGKQFITVQAGITVRNLKTELDNRGLALINMGGYDGQTISGTLSTGTHGSGVSFGPLASFAASIVLVSESSSVYQIEPAAGITDPAKFTGVLDGVPMTLKQDDDWFRAAQVAMGCLGVIYGYTLEVTSSFSIRELRTATTWNDIKSSLAPELWNPVPPAVANVDHFELILNPYTRWFRNACIRVERTRLPGSPPASGQRQDWLGELLQQIAVQRAEDLVRFLEKVPFVSPLVIDKAIMSLVETAPYVDKSFNVFSYGSANEIKAMALELHCDARLCVPTVDKLLRVFQEQAVRYQWYLAGPLGIRFVAASDAFVAPEAGRLTCTMELDMLVGVDTGRDLARRVKEEMCTGDSASVRVHWGLDLDFVTKDDLRAWYPDFERWRTVHEQLNSTGMFNNSFTDRMGISV